MARKKRSFGQIDHLPSGKWRARYTGPDSVLHKAPATFYDEGDAIAWLRSEQKLIEFDEWTPPAERTRSREDTRRTVGTWLAEWLAIQTAAGLEPSTIQDYERTLNARVIKTTGAAAKLRGVPLLRLRRRDVIEWWDAVTKQFGAQPYNYNAFRRLHTALADAVDRELIPANPAAGIKAIKKPKAHRKELPEIEVMDTLLAAMPATTSIITVMTLYHGLRIGEALGLRRRDITDTGTIMTIHVRGNVWRKVGEGAQYKARAKTDAAHRNVPIFHRFHHHVRDHLDAHVGDSPDAWLVTTGTGKLMMDTSFRSIQTRAKTRAGLGDVRITPHYGRVWLITTLAEQGMSPAAIGEILGQRDLRTITEIYMRATKEKSAEILGRVDQMITEQPDNVVPLDTKRGHDQESG